MIRVAICGDSYSEEGFYTSPLKPRPISWVTRLRDDFDISSYAYRGMNNVEIYQSVPADDTYDVLIASLAPIARHGAGDLYYSGSWDPLVKERCFIPEVRENIRAAYRLTRYKNSYIWSSFSDYDNIPNINYINIDEWDQHYHRRNHFEEQKSGKWIYTNHYTEEGNHFIHQHMKHVIESIYKDKNI